jgi:membrane-associated HD superfamily phosphohydrolase
MKTNVLQLVLGLILALFFVISGNAQITNQADNSRGKEEEKSQGLQETMAKWKIKAEKKDYEELLKRGDEAEKLVTELTKTYQEKQTLTREDAQKLDKLEKLVKKIRTEVGAEDDNEPNDDKPKDLVDAIKMLSENTEKLVKELKKTTRHSISVVLIETSNTMLKLVKFIRFNKN